MKKLAAAAAVLVLGLAAPALAQMAPTGPVVNGPAQPTPTPPSARFAPQPLKNQDSRGLLATIKANTDAWDHQDTAAIANAWSFPASVVTTDAMGNPVYAQVDAEALKAAFGSLFAEIPKPGPGQRAAEVKFNGQNILWLSNSLAVITHQVNLSQGSGKTMYRQQWKVSQVWARDTQGNWRIRSYVGSGWGDLIKH